MQGEIAFYVEVLFSVSYEVIEWSPYNKELSWYQCAWSFFRWSKSPTVSLCEAHWLIVILICIVFVESYLYANLFAPLDVFCNTVMLRWIQEDLKENLLRFRSFKYILRKRNVKPGQHWHCEYWFMEQVYFTDTNFQNCTETLMIDLHLKTEKPAHEHKTA